MHFVRAQTCCSDWRGILFAMFACVTVSSGCGSQTSPAVEDLEEDEPDDDQPDDDVGDEDGPKQGGKDGGSSASAGSGGSSTAPSDAGAKPEPDGLGQAGGTGGKPSPVFNGQCPTQPPFDEKDEALLAACTRPVVVAVGNALRRTLSFDGQTWFGDVWFPAGGDENENSHRGVAVGNGIIVIAGDGGILVSRDAGLTFVRKDTGRSLHNSDVLFFGGAFWVMGGGGTHTTVDGTTWTSWKEADSLPGGIRAGFGASGGATNGERAIFVGGDTYRAFDGKVWSEGKIGGGAERVVFGKDRFATVSSFSSTTYASANGTNWMGRSSSGRFGDIASDGTEFFASGSQFDINGQKSPDGLTWTRYRMSNPIGPVTRFNGMYVGANGETLYRSTNARMWTNPHRAVGGEAGFTSIASGPVLKPAN